MTDPTPARPTAPLTVQVMPSHILSRCDDLSCADERRRLGLNPLVSDLERIARKVLIRDLVRGGTPC